MAKTIITAALTGAATPKEKNPALPVTPKEIAEDAVRAWRAGAAIVHLHMRDEHCRGTMDAARFKETVERIRDSCDVIINLTSSGELGASDQRRMEHIIALRPEMATFDAASLNVLPDGIFDNTVGFLTKLAATMKDCGVKPEVEVFDLGSMAALARFLETGMLEAPVHVQFVLGMFAGAPATPENLMYLKQALPQEATWSALGVGAAHLPILYTAVALGGHVRVGLEDNLYFAKGQLATNESLVTRAAQIIRAFNNEPATPAQARALLGLKPR